MPFPSSWPPTTGTSRKSIRAFASGTTTDDFADNAFMFAELAGLVSCGRVEAWPRSSIRVYNDGTADIWVSFDGTNVHGVVKPGGHSLWENRTESGISVRSPDTKVAAFRIEAW